jgi:signal transduction histidine kinase
VLSDLDDIAREFSRRLRELGAELESNRGERERADSACRRQLHFLGRVSHELRGPLAGLQLQLDRLESDVETPPKRRRELLTRMRSSIEKIHQIAEGIVEVVRVEGRRLDAPTELVDLRKVVAEVAAELGPRAAQKGLDLAIEDPGPVPRIQADPGLLHLVVHHLADNAVEFTERGSVTLELAAKDHECLIIVSDTGPGIEPGESERIFEPFVCGDLGRSGSPRRGLGLALARAVVQSLEGAIEIEPAAGGGSRCTVRLPSRAGDAG